MQRAVALGLEVAILTLELEKEITVVAIEECESAIGSAGDEGCG